MRRRLSTMKSSPFALVLGALLAASGCARQPGPDAAPVPRNLVLVSLDTLRRDHLSTYGYRRPTSPGLDRLAASSVVFERAFTQATNTEPSHLTLFTGVLPDRHHVWGNGRPFKGEQPTLASLLDAAGFRTAGFVSGLTMQWQSNVGVGFEFYDDKFPGGRRNGGVTVDHALKWLRGPQAKTPYFLFVHLFDVHGPYYPPPGFANRFHSPGPRRPIGRLPKYQIQMHPAGVVVTDSNYYVDRYDEVIRYEDSLVTRLLAAVDLRTTIVVVLADHGESLDERYWKLDHGGSVFDEQMRVPLILHVPGWQARRVRGMVGLVDVMPTVLELLRVKADPKLRLEGRSMVPYLTKGAPPPRTAVVAVAQVHAERLVPLHYDLDDRRCIIGLRDGRWKVIHFPGKATDYAQLFDVAADPGELHDLAARRPARRDRMLRQLAVEIDPRQRQQKADSDRQLEEQLRSLGYVND